MAGNSWDADNIQVYRYRKKWHFNIGIIIFGVIFLYLLVTILMFVTAKRVSVYEVREGSIVKDNAYTGLALREETVVTAEESGYVNYFVPEGSKIGMKTDVYSISGKKLSFSSGQEDKEEKENTLSSEEQNMIAQKAQNFGENFQDSKFDDVYTFQDSVESILSSSSSQTRKSQLAAMIEGGEKGLNAYNATEDGVVVYCVDGYEDVAKDQVTADMLSRADYGKTEFVDNAEVQKGDPVYKLVTSETWSLVIELDDATAQELAETKSVQVKFAKDGETTWGEFAVYNTEDSNLGFLTFDHSMVRYAADRFLDIELILEDETGLKIPKSAVAKKEFYTVPEDYITQGGNSSGTGVMVRRDGDTVQFRELNVYYRDQESGMVYLDMEDLKEGDVLVMPDSQETCQVRETKKLEGVYNINKGYAVFRQIHILCESEEYYIVESGNDYGLTNYDHIALDGSEVREHEIVF